VETNLDLLYKTDEDKETEGFWYEVGDGVAFKLRRVGGKNSKRLQKSNAKYFKPYAKAIQQNLLSEEKLGEITAKAFVDGIVADWRGLKIDGEDAPFSFDTAVTVFSQFPDLMDDLHSVANDKGNYREDLGNS
jgi:hypothetical protein